MLAQLLVADLVAGDLEEDVVEGGLAQADGGDGLAEAAHELGQEGLPAVDVECERVVVPRRLEPEVILDLCGRSIEVTAFSTCSIEGRATSSPFSSWSLQGPQNSTGMRIEP